MLVKIAITALLTFAAASSSLAINAPPWVAGLFADLPEQALQVERSGPRAGGRAARICVGPARLEVSLAERPHIVFGGEGCASNQFALFAVKIVPARAAASATVVSALTS